MVMRRIYPLNAWLLAVLLLITSVQLAQGQCNNCWLVAQGPQIVNASTGEPVVLRSVGLGYWLLQEGYMLNPSGCPGCPGTQWQMKLQYLNEGQSMEQVENFYQQWRDQFITEADIEYLASLGFNSVRLPMHYELFLTSEQRAVRNAVVTNFYEGHEQYKAALQAWHDNGMLFADPNAEGFQVIDRLVNWCKSNGMYVILDLHAAPGAQGTDLNICDGFFNNNLWDFPVFQDVTNQLWLSISNRYKSEPHIAMYELINEPNNVPGGGPAIQALTQRIISTIRANGDNHLITIHGNGWGNDYGNLEPFNFWPNWGLVYSSHRYWIDPAIDWIPNGNPNVINRMIDLVNFRDTHRVPVWVGETGENSNEWMSQNIAALDNAGIGWCHWTYKRHDWQENPALMRIGGNYPTDGAAAMATVLESIRFQNLIPNLNTQAAVTATLPPPGTSGCSGSTIDCAPIGRTIWIKGSNGLYVSSQNGQSAMMCDRPTVDDWEMFKVVDAGYGKVALQGTNELFVSTENGQSPMFCNRPFVDAWETFDWTDFGNGSFGLRRINGRYVSSEDGLSGMTCNRETAGAWETFTYDTIGFSVAVDSFTVTRGTLAGGGVAELAESDDVDVSAQR